jgi:hypothetical protein
MKPEKEKPEMNRCRFRTAAGPTPKPASWASRCIEMCSTQAAVSGAACRFRLKDPEPGAAVVLARRGAESNAHYGAAMARPVDHDSMTRVCGRTSATGWF